MRESGVLLPIFSLPSRFGIGCFSKEAYEFVDQLEKAGTEQMADFTAWTDRIWRFTLSVIFDICGKSIILSIWKCWLRRGS